MAFYLLFKVFFRDDTRIPCRKTTHFHYLFNQIENVFEYFMSYLDSHNTVRMIKLKPKRKQSPLSTFSAHFKLFFLKECRK
jgi:hypothetical protein